jgi:hypothetical protein
MLAQTKSNQEEISALIYSFTNPKATYRKEFLVFDTIERAHQVYNRKITEKTKHLSGKAKHLLCPIVQKLLRGKPVLLNSKYIQKVTECGVRQSKNILNELRGILHIKYQKSTKQYLFEFIPAIVYELSSKKEIVSCNKLHASYNDSIYKENNNIEDIDLESNFLQNSEEDTITPIETVKFKKQLPNERKAGVYHFNQYKEPQPLSYHYPLTKEDGEKLQSLSGREFSLNAMNEILLDMSKRRDNRFCSKAQFMAYFGTCLKYEMRDAVKTGNDNFRIKANISKEEVKKPRIINQTEIRAYDLENRNTDGFQPITDALDKLIVKLV